MIRLIFAALALIIYLILWLPLMLILLLVRKRNRKLSAKIALIWAVPFLKLILFISGSKVTVIGKENIPTDEAVLFVSNHRSIFDVITAVACMPVHAAFMAKIELSGYPLFSQWLTLLDVLFLDHTDIKQELKSILKAIDLIKDGTSVWICPEGTRNKNNDNENLLEFKEGSLKMAEKTGCRVVPVAFYGTREVFERQFPKLVPSRITMEFGKPFRIKELPEDMRKRAGLYSREVISGMLRKETERRKETEKQ